MIFLEACFQSFHSINDIFSILKDVYYPKQDKNKTEVKAS